MPHAAAETRVPLLAAAISVDLLAVGEVEHFLVTGGKAVRYMHQLKLRPGLRPGFPA